uniref:II-FBPL precursor n=1 Tax=Xenopus tropicalis TaxID=8364 RepID=A0A6I8QQG6_XENTR
LSLLVSAINLARSEGVSVSQSSVYPLNPPPNAQTAVDGNKETNYYVHPCAHTNKDFAPWWQLDLKKSIKIWTVVITTRRDCCSERLLGAEIRVGDSADNKNPVCDTIKVGSQGTITLCCEGLEGRYVSVVIPGREENLSLCEVEVYGQEAKAVEVNLARLGDVKQSSTYRPEYNAATAVDGNKNSNMMLGSCSHTNSDNPAWWQLDLKKRYQVEKVVIVNRGDCCGERLRGAEVRVGNSADNNNPVCATVTDVSQLTLTLSCKGIPGRYVSVVIPGRAEYLQLCEVEVYGKEAESDGVKLCW